MALIALIDKVTDRRLLEPDYNNISKLVDLVNQDIVDPEDAVQLVQHKILDENPKTACLALKVLEALFYQCGNLVHRIICTSDYMTLLENILKKSHYYEVQVEILKLVVDWADRFKFFPNYSAPQDLLKSLVEEGFLTAEQLKDIRAGVKSLKKSASSTNRVKSNDNGHHTYSSYSLSAKHYSENSTMNTSQNVCTSGHLEYQDCSEKKSEEFNKEMEEIKAEKKRRYKEYLRANNLPTSSDEEDIVIDANEKNSRLSLPQHEVQDSSTGYEYGAIKKRLPKEMAISKKQKENLKSQTDAIRKEKHDVYKKNCSNYDQDLKKCIFDDCNECQKYKENSKEDVVFVQKQLPLEMRKIKESKKLLNESWQEVRKGKNRDYYNRQNNSRFEPNSNGSRERSLMASEDEQLNIAVQLSRVENQPSYVPPSRSTLGDLEEERLLREALEISRVVTSCNPMQHPSNEDGEEEIQRAISLSLAESDMADFDAMPALDEDLQMSFARQLSLDEQRRSLESAGDRHDWSSCVICHDIKRLKRFRPCLHKGICDECSKDYKGDICVLCRRIYQKLDYD
ncbi:hypothetical protein QAD02_006126 [Eretmocerus hayati]|uniref:Uncharacterized protein n=1 Tax=Eretmocerus hayati TaxID=131215 RepID=A0ACC2N043_9HYME|nr:hypothetical protein QAD02_006126 [Eretmocerus hayati]